jgi:hypothetical protein
MSLSLNCLIHGEDQEKMFTIKIPKTENISILKKLIKEEKASLLNDVDASDLDLWMLDLDLDGFRAEPVLVDFDACSKLSPPRRTLSSFFKGTLDREHLHVIAKPPSTSH